MGDMHRRRSPSYSVLDSYLAPVQVKRIRQELRELETRFSEFLVDFAERKMQKRS
jgi:hypothetical protein